MRDFDAIRTIDIIREVIRKSKITHVHSNDNYLGLSLLRIHRKCPYLEYLFRIDGLAIKEVQRELGSIGNVFAHSFSYKLYGLTFNFAAPDSIPNFIEFLQRFKR